MSTLTASKAREKLYGLIDQVSNEHEPVLIAGKRNNAVLVGEEDWRNIQETLYLSRSPDLKKTIQDGMKTPASEMDEDIEW